MSAPVPWTLDHLSADEVARPAMRATIRDLFAEVYAERPYLRGPGDADTWARDTLARHLANPGFRLVFARAPGPTGTPYGFALGTPLLTDTRWWTGMVDPLPAAMTRENGRQTFAVYEFAIRRPHRRHGLGRAMHRALVGPWTGSRTTLTLRPSAPAAVAFWAAMGYRSVGFSRPRPADPLYTMMLRDHDPAR